MNQSKVKIIFFLCLTLTLFLGAVIKKGDKIYISDFNSQKYRSEWSTLSSAQWVNQGFANKTCLFINGTGMVSTSIHLAPYRGMQLQFKCFVKAENVTKPAESYLGVKFMLHYKSTTGEVWKNQNDVYGTFGWKELFFLVAIPNDVTDGDLNLGLQGCTGKVWFDSISLIVQKTPMVAPIKKSNKLKASTKFRGVMSPIIFNHNDIQVLGKDWGANLIRWQLNMTNAQTKVVGTDLTKYDNWITEKLKELDNVLIVCKQYGIKVVIDLHSIPGGRDSNGTKIFYFKEFNDHFIKVWQSIARRYNGNPSVWGYDLMNEPLQNKSTEKGMDYISTQIKASRAIRNIDKKTAIIFEVEEMDSPSGFISLSPIPVSNVIYEVHMYQPGTFTHQGVFDNTNSISYPGRISGISYDKNVLKDRLQPVRDFQLKYNVPIYVGEFSAIRWAPGAAQYLSDCIDIFEDYGWNWTYHAYREWDGWDVEYENGTSKTDPPKRATLDTDRKKVLLKWFAKNKK